MNVPTLDLIGIAHLSVSSIKRQIMSFATKSKEAAAHIFSFLGTIFHTIWALVVPLVVSTTSFLSDKWSFPFLLLRTSFSSIWTASVSLLRSTISEFADNCSSSVAKDYAREEGDSVKDEIAIAQFLINMREDVEKSEKKEFYFIARFVCVYVLFVTVMYCMVHILG